MNTRHAKIGIKQVIRLEWMEKTLDMLLAGMPADDIRAELKLYLADKKQSGGTGSRGAKTYQIAIGPLAQSWIEPEEALIPLRNAALAFARACPSSQRLPLHWAMISAAYPFWFQVALQTGRLLNLQDRVTQTQIVTRLKEQYGDRQTISRYARYTIRSLVAWGVLQDTSTKGCYVKAESLIVTDQHVVSLFLESTLHALPEGRGAFHQLLHTPAFFPFHLIDLPVDLIPARNPRLEVLHAAGFDDYMLNLNSIPQLRWGPAEA